MNMPHDDASIAILIANGFNETQITTVQRTLTTAKIPHHIIAPEQGLVNGWRNGNWGHHFNVDRNISTAMGSDYECLIIVGGEAGINKLKSNLHTRRIINHFLEAKKPVAAIGEGVELLALSPKSAGLTVSAPNSLKDVLDAANIEVSQDARQIDNSVLTSDGTEIDAWISTAVDMFNSHQEQIQAAA